MQRGLHAFLAPNLLRLLKWKYTAKTLSSIEAPSHMPEFASLRHTIVNMPPTAIWGWIWHVEKIHYQGVGAHYQGSGLTVTATVIVRAVAI